MTYINISSWKHKNKSTSLITILKFLNYKGFSKLLNNFKTKLIDFNYYNIFSVKTVSKCCTFDKIQNKTIIVNHF